MPSTSSTTDARADLASSTRIFITLTGAEAAALGRLSHEGDVEAIRALAKIRSALEHAIADAVGPAPSAVEVPPLRTKHYRPRTPPALRMAKADLSVQISVDTAAAPERLRMAKAALRPKVPTTRSRRAAPAPELDDDYVPYRDEADGIYT